MTGIRAFICLALVGATALASRGMQSDAPARPAKLDALSYRVGEWRGVAAPEIDDQTAAALGADEYLNRTYTAGGAAPIGLYIAYYASQRTGGSIHSPLNCLPGTGWEPAAVATLEIERPDGSPGQVRRLLVQKSGEQAMVLYWYQIHGRMLASELASKGYLLADALRFGRSDAFLVRVVVPASDSTAAAGEQGLAFVRALLPPLTGLFDLMEST
jgi:EpsI family protein